MHPTGFRTRVALVVLAALVAASVALLRSGVELAATRSAEPTGPLAGLLPPYLVVGRWLRAAEFEWRDATTGWQTINVGGSPRKDGSFVGGAMRIAGVEYEHGIGTYPFSEIEYELGGEFALLRAKVGVDDRSPADAAAVFQVQADDTVVFQSAPISRGEAALEVTVPIAGAAIVHLVVARDPAGAVPAYANWADLEVFAAGLSFGEAPTTSLLLTASARPARPRTGAAEREMLSARAQEEERYIAQMASQGSAVAAVSDPRRQRHFLSNNELALIFEGRGAEPNSLTLLDRRHGRLLAHGVSLGVTIGRQRMVSLVKDAVIEEDHVRFSDVNERVFGSGKALTIRFRVRPDDLVVVLRLTLFSNSRHVLLEADVPGVSPAEEIGYVFLKRELGPGLVVGARAEILTDLTQVRRTVLYGDGLAREVAFDSGKPVVLWGQQIPGSLLIAPLDETRRTPWLRMELPPESVRAALSLALSNRPDSTASPRLYVEASPSRDLREAAANYRRILDVEQPEPPIPSWVRFQWSSWYPFEMNISHEVISRQVDLIAEHFADLGPWHVVVDAGWYVAEGKPGSDLRAVDRDKFPQGIRALVDSIHGKGIKVVMYTTMPYLDDRQLEGNWAGLRGTIERRPEWLIPLGRRGGAAYTFNYAHPGVQAYVFRLLRDIFQAYDADGLLIDGLGTVEPTLVARRFFDERGLVSAVLDQTMEIYRLMWQAANRLYADIYIEGGVHNPAFARRYAHTFRQADEIPAFSAPYPGGGLIEHIDYATYQKVVLGQRPNMGALTADEGAAAINLAWLRAGVALDSQVTLSFDLGTLKPGDVAEYRALLNHYRPFTGRTVVDAVLKPSVFVTHKGDVAYLGLLNRSGEEKAFTVRLSEFGLLAETEFTLFDTAERRGYRARGEFLARLPPESFRLFVIASRPGPVWSSSSYAFNLSARRLGLELSGPAHVPGFVAIAVPPPQRVLLDGQPYTRYAYDQVGGILTVQYSHERPRQLDVEF